MTATKDKTALAVNPSLTLAGIPPETFRYRLGNRSALEWVIDQYQVSEDKRSGIRSDPNRTVIPGIIVSAVVIEPWGAHPSYAQGYYDRDNDFYVAWESISRDPDKLARYLDEFVYDVPDRAGYMEKQPHLGVRLKAKERLSRGVNYGF